jgi:hypothetical protein
MQPGKEMPLALQFMVTGEHAIAGCVLAKIKVQIKTLSREVHSSGKE